MSEHQFITGSFHTAGGGQRATLNTERVVYRYRLPITDVAEVEMPERPDILSLGPPRDGRDELDMWALINPDAPLRTYRFLVCGTGHPVPENRGAFVGSVTTHGGQLVWHVWVAA